MDTKFLEKLKCYSDLHYHFDGAISVENAKSLASYQNINLNMTDLELADRLHVSENCKDLNEYLTKFDLPCSLLMTKEALTLATKNILKESVEEGLMYIEFRYAPQLLTKKGMSMEDSVNAMIKGIKEFKDNNSNSDIEANIILCMMRGKDNTKENYETIDLAEQYNNKGVVAVDLAGAEAIYPNGLFEDLFNYANNKNLNLIIHAGEADGKDSVHSAIKYNPKRIGHGVRSYEDIAVVKELADNKIPIELCPTSNLNTKIFDNISQYPLRLFFENGVICTINTDNKSVSNINIKNEYKILNEAFDLTKEEIEMLLKNSIKYSFAEEETKQKLLLKIDKDLNN